MRTTQVRGGQSMATEAKIWKNDMNSQYTLQKKNQVAIEWSVLFLFRADFAVTFLWLSTYWIWYLNIPQQNIPSMCFCFRLQQFFPLGWHGWALICSYKSQHRQCIWRFFKYFITIEKLCLITKKLSVLLQGVLLAKANAWKKKKCTLYVFADHGGSERQAEYCENWFLSSTAKVFLFIFKPIHCFSKKAFWK